MSRKITEIQALIAAALNALPGVFSMVQWGGRAYKVGTPKKFKLLSHVCLTREEDAVDLGFKLEKSRAADVTEEFDWIKRHSFRTLASAGWIEAKVNSKSQVKVIAKLLKESRAMYPTVHQPLVDRRKRKPGSSAESEIVVQRLNNVVASKRAQGWRPAQSDDFDN